MNFMTTYCDCKYLYLPDDGLTAAPKCTLLPIIQMNKQPSMLVGRKEKDLSYLY